jgi:hypothetical protein
MDLSLRLGDLLQIATVAAGGLMVFAQMRADSKNIKERLGAAEEELAKQTVILTQLAAGEARMDGLDRRLQLLENARGRAP